MKNEKPKVGIMTFWWSQCNYGQVLQAFSMQKMLEEIGCSAFIIRYDSRKEKFDIQRALFLLSVRMRLVARMLIRGVLFKKIIARVRKRPLMHSEEIEKERQFDEFREKHLKFSGTYTSLKDLQDAPPEADIYICGSDQIWNPKLGGRYWVNGAYLLDFGSSMTKRISYAASLGGCRYSLLSSIITKRMLKKFDKIGVREISGKNTLEDIGIRNVYVNPDPTLVVDSTTFYNLANCVPRVGKERYCFVYLIGNESEFCEEQIREIAASKGLDIIYTGSGKDSGFKNHRFSIEQWLSAILYADIIITNSFHGIVFSIIFKKQFFVLRLTGQSVLMYNRIQELMSMFEIENRQLIGGCAVAEDNIKYCRYESQMSYCKKSARDYLSEIAPSMMCVNN